MYHFQFNLSTVQRPNVTITSSLSGILYSGTQIRLFCIVLIPLEVDTSVVVNTMWIGPQGPITNEDRFNVQTIPICNTTLHISPLNKSDSGTYQCVGNISSNSTYIKASSNSSANIPLSVQGKVDMRPVH